MKWNQMKSHSMAVPPIAIAPLWISPPGWISWPRRQSYKRHPARHWDPRRGLCPLWPRPPDLGWFWILDAIYLGTQSWTTDLKKRHGRWYAHESWMALKQCPRHWWRSKIHWNSPFHCISNVCSLGTEPQVSWLMRRPSKRLKRGTSLSPHHTPPVYKKSA